MGDAGVLGDGAVYDPATNTWKPISTMGTPPSPRTQHTAVWADSATPPQMIVWGGSDGNSTYFGDGASFDPDRDVVDRDRRRPRGQRGPWTKRARHSGAVSTGSQMIVFGGFGLTTTAMPTLVYLDDAYLYDPPSAMWMDVSPGAGTLVARADHTATWDTASSTMIVFGGVNGPNPLSDGASLTGTTWKRPSWAPRRTRGRASTASDVGGKLFVFGGNQGAGAFLGTGDELDAIAGIWTWTLALPTAPSPRSNHTAVSTGTTLFIWGGDTDQGATNTGAQIDTTKVQ